jgi:hypothetical protein
VCMSEYRLIVFSFHLNFNLVYSVSKFPTPKNIKQTTTYKQHQE